MSTKYLMIVDGACPACSSLGKELSHISEIRAVAEQSEEGERLRTQLDFEAPCLVRLDGGAPRVFNGWRMRLELIRILGWKGSKHWGRLLYREMEARQSRNGITRRSALVGAGAGVVAALLNISPAAADETSPGGESIRTATTTQTNAAVASAEGAQAISNWGEATTAYRMTNGGASATALVHSPNHMTFLMDGLPGGSFSLRLVKENLEIYAISGALVATLNVTQKQAKPVYAQASGGLVQPMSFQTFIGCLAICMGADAANRCGWDCAQAVYDPANTLVCVACAGRLGVSCAWGCRYHII